MNVIGSPNENVSSLFFRLVLNENEQTKREAWLASMNHFLQEGVLENGY